MIPLPVAVLDGLGRVDARAAEVTGVHVDSRRVRPGDLFVAVGRGEEFLGDAHARGAAATLVPDDAFDGAFLAALVRGAAPMEALQAGCAAGASAAASDDPWPARVAEEPGRG